MVYTTVVIGILTQSGDHKRVIGKQCRLRSDAAEYSVWWGSLSTVCVSFTWKNVHKYCLED